MMTPEKAMMISPVNLAARIERDARERVVAALVAVVVERERPGLLEALRGALEAAQGVEQTDREAADALADAERKVAELSAIAPRGESIFVPAEKAKVAQALKAAEGERDAAKAHARYCAGVVADTRARARELEQRIAAVEAMPAPDPDVLRAIRGGKA